MKFFGYVFIVLGVTLLIYISILFLRDSDILISPLPDSKGVKVIYVTPGK